MHAEGGKIALQILHTGRYGYSPLCVAPSRLQSPISPFTPRALTARGIERQIKAFVRCAVLAREAGYDGVEVMGSEGYLINQFLVTPRTNLRTDDWGGDVREPHAARRRDRAPRARGGRAGLHPDLPDLDDRPDPGGQHLGRGGAARQGRDRAAGATILNTGIGWHEARIPTIVTSVPRAAFGWVTGKMRAELRAAGVTIPLVTSNRINTPEVAEGCSPPASTSTARPTWCRWRGRSWPTRPSWKRRRRAAPTRSTPASPATRPASTTRSATSRRPAWSIRAPASRPS